MTLSENEMARLMMDNIEVIIPGEFTLRKPIATTMWGFDKAAHAIAEKLAEGVVFEAVGKADYEAGLIMLPNEGELYVGTEDWEGKSGHSYHVTVTKEE